MKKKLQIIAIEKGMTLNDLCVLYLLDGIIKYEAREKDIVVYTNEMYEFNVNYSLDILN